MQAYAAFLNGEVTAVNISPTDNKEAFFIHDVENKFLQPGIDCFALLDMNEDGIPELHTKGYCYSVFSFLNSKVVHLYTTPAGLETAYALENCALIAWRNSTATTYEYTTFNNTVATTVSFFDGSGREENPLFDFNGEIVSKSEFENLTKSYIEAADKPATMKWYDYKSLHFLYMISKTPCATHKTFFTICCFLYK